MDADVHCPFELPDCPGQTGYSSELANAMAQGESELAHEPLSETQNSTP